MRSGAEDPHLVDVELVEDLEVRPLGGRPRARPSTAGQVVGQVPHPRLWSAIGALGVVALAGWGMNQAEERRDESRLEALAGLPGYLDPLTDPLTVAWSADAGRPVALTSAGVLVTADAVGSGAATSLAALDLVTGAVVWRRALPGEGCLPLAHGQGPGIATASLVVCLPHPAAGAPSGGRVTVLDAGTGQEVRVEEAGASTLVELVDGLVLLTGPSGNGAVGVRAWDPVSGEDAWAFTSTPGATATVRTAPGWSHEAADGVVTFISGDVRMAFDAVSARRQREATAADRETLDLPRGREARWGYDRFGRPKDVVVVDRDGGARYAVPGVPWLAPVSDGSAHEVVVVRRTADKHLLGLDAGSGRVRWDLANVPWLEASVQVGGIVVAVSPSSAVAIDLRTGLRLWDHGAARGAATWDVLTDGRVVLVPTDDGAGEVTLAARRLQTGEEAWEVPLPGAVVAVDQVDGATVLVLTQAALVALR